MCGRFTYRLTWPELVRLYRLTLDAPARNTQPRYNICPTTNIDAVIERDGKRELSTMRWGLIPSWWSKPLKEMKVATFNARAETVASKPVFREAFKRTRCLIPASGYYEWQDTSDGMQPYYFTAGMGNRSRLTLSTSLGKVLKREAVMTARIINLADYRKAKEAEQALPCLRMLRSTIAFGSRLMSRL